MTRVTPGTRWDGVLEERPAGGYARAGPIGGYEPAGPAGGFRG
ncbi:hypothetical protein [Nonomuraea sp. NPDC049480]